MNIDIRNATAKTEEAVNQIKQAFNMATNTEAVQYAAQNFLKEREARKYWEKRGTEAENKLNNIKNHWQELNQQLTQN